MPKDAEPRITFYVIICRCKDPCRFCGDGGSEQIGNELINFLLVIVAVCRNSALIYRRIFWWNVSKEVISVPMKKYSRQDFGEVVRKINQGVDAVQEDEVAFDPVAESEVFDINVSCPRCWFLCISHCGSAVVVFIRDGGGFLRYIKVPKNATYE
jgi:hypothetical protein